MHIRIHNTINYNWCYGFGLTIACSGSVVRGILMLGYYICSSLHSNGSIRTTKANVNNGLLTYIIHSHCVSLVNLMCNLHILRGLYVSSNNKTNTWSSGNILYIHIAAIGYVGYVLTFGCMSYWAGIVILGLFITIPSLLNLLYGGFNMCTTTL